ncbi:chloride channel protein [Clostridioides difficile]|nr:chloride channel protein [Clostridioides difficile]
MNPDYVNNFVLLAMAGYFTAIVRAPLTGIILIFEMTGSVSQMLSLSVISIVAYIVATLMKSKPIYESLLERLLEKMENLYIKRGRKDTRPVFCYVWVSCCEQGNSGCTVA